jgi:hypothetical protein
VIGNPCLIETVSTFRFSLEHFEPFKKYLYSTVQRLFQSTVSGHLSSTPVWWGSDTRLSEHAWGRIFDTVRWEVVLRSGVVAVEGPLSTAAVFFEPGAAAATPVVVDNPAIGGAGGSALRWPLAPVEIPGDCSRGGQQQQQQQQPQPSAVGYSSPLPPNGAFRPTVLCGSRAKWL